MPEERQPAGRVLYFDLLRILSIFAMVLLHINAQKFLTAAVGSLNWNISNFYQGLVRFCVPVFVMISGAFLLDGNREYSLKKLYFQKILRLVTAYVFWATLYAAYTVLSRNPIGAASLLKIVKLAIRGHYHLWFMYMIVGLYIASPLLRVICRSRRTAEYFLALWFVFELALNLLCVSGPLARLVSSFRSKVAFHTALGYAGFFVLGHYLANYQLPACAVRALHALGALSLAFTVGGTLYLSLRSGSATEALIHNLLPNTAFVSASIFLLVKRRFEHSAPSPRVARAVGTLSKLCFGAYLVHDFFIILFRKLGILSPNFFPALSVLLIAAAVMALSLLAAHLLNKIPVLNRYIL